MAYEGTTILGIYQGQSAHPDFPDQSGKVQMAAW